MPTAGCRTSQRRPLPIPRMTSDDLIPAVRGALSNDGKMFAVPFYAESSFIMYRKDLADAAGVTIPDAPTWDDIAAAAKAMKTDDVAGICLRGKPGWGDLGASLTTVVNTFGGTWWDANDDGSIGAAQVNTGGFKDAFNFYNQLLKDAGQPDAANASFNECLKLMQDSKAAMWYDATVAAGILEAADSPIKGKLGLRAGSHQGDAGVWLAVVLGAGHAGGHREHGRRLEVHELGYLEGVHQARRY